MTSYACASPDSSRSGEDAELTFAAINGLLCQPVAHATNAVSPSTSVTDTDVGTAQPSTVRYHTTANKLPTREPVNSSKKNWLNTKHEVVHSLYQSLKTRQTANYCSSVGDLRGVIVGKIWAGETEIERSSSGGMRDRGVNDGMYKS